MHFSSASNERKMGKEKVQPVQIKNQKTSLSGNRLD